MGCGDEGEAPGVAHVGGSPVRRRRLRPGSTGVGCLIAVVLPEMQFSLSNKRTDKEAWDAIAAARIGSDPACKSTLQALRKEW